MNGKSLINGSNGREHWLVRPERLVLVSNDPSEFRIPMPEDMAAIPLAGIRLCLSRLRSGYELKELAAEAVVEGSSVRCATGREQDRFRHERAETVSIWFHPTTNAVGKIEFDQIHFQGRPEPRRMTMTLVSSEPLPADWFEHAAHHPQQTPVEKGNQPH